MIYSKIGVRGGGGGGGGEGELITGSYSAGVGVQENLLIKS